MHTQDFSLSDRSPEEVSALLARIGLSQGQIARETGLTTSTVSRICRGQYASDAGDAARRVEQVITAAMANHPVSREATDPAKGVGMGAAAGSGGETPVVRLAAARLPEAAPSLAAPWGGAYCTDGQRLMWGVLRAIVEDRELGLLTSLSGTGKSYVVDRFAEQYPGTLVYRPLRGISQSGVMEDLCRLFGVPYSGSNDTRRRRLLEAAHGRNLLIDEADLLVAGRYATQAVDRLEIYRQLQERGCAVALVGLPALLHTVQRGGETYVFSRIGYARAPAAPSETELATYWRAQVAGYPSALNRAGLVAMSAGKHGFLRYLDKLARRTHQTGGDVAAAETLLFRGDSV